MTPYCHCFASLFIDTQLLLANADAGKPGFLGQRSYRSDVTRGHFLGKRAQTADSATMVGQWRTNHMGRINGARILLSVLVGDYKGWKR